MIDWRPIEEIPDELKDGRQVLLWDGVFGAQVARWQRFWDTGFASEIDGDPIAVEDATHFAEISPPD